jgi:hypothetical protein
MATAIRSIVVPFKHPAAVIVIPCLLILVTVGVKARVGSNATADSTNQQLSSRTARGPAQIVRFTVYDVGIFPSEARASAGLVALHLEDMSGDAAGLVVMSESLQMVGQIVRRPDRGRDNARLTLLPGRYSIYNASRPTHRATLIIAP